MSPSNNLNPGFVTVEDAIGLIKSDTADEAVVDLQFLTNNIPYLKEKHNYNIRLLKTQKDGSVVYNGEVFVNVATKYDKEVLLKTIIDAYTARTGIALNADTLGLNKITTMVDEETGSLSGNVRTNPDSKVQYKTDISTSYSQVLNNVGN